LMKVLKNPYYHDIQDLVLNFLNVHTHFLDLKKPNFYQTIVAVLT